MAKYLYILFFCILFAGIAFSFPADSDFCFCKDNKFVTGADALKGITCQTEKMMYTFFAETLSCFTGEKPKKPGQEEFPLKDEFPSNDIVDVPPCKKNNDGMKKDGDWNGIDNVDSNINTKTNDDTRVCKIEYDKAKIIYGKNDKHIEIRDQDNGKTKFYDVDGIPQSIGTWGDDYKPCLAKCNASVPGFKTINTDLLHSASCQDASGNPKQVRIDDLTYFFPVTSECDSSYGNNSGVHYDKICVFTGEDTTDYVGKQYSTAGNSYLLFRYSVWDQLKPLIQSLQCSRGCTQKYLIPDSNYPNNIMQNQLDCTGSSALNSSSANMLNSYSGPFGNFDTLSDSGGLNPEAFVLLPDYPSNPNMRPCKIGTGLKTKELCKSTSSNNVYWKLGDIGIFPYIDGSDKHKIKDKNGNLVADEVPKQTIINAIPDILNGKSLDSIFGGVDASNDEFEVLNDTKCSGVNDLKGKSFYEMLKCTGSTSGWGRVEELDDVKKLTTTDVSNVCYKYISDIDPRPDVASNVDKMIFINPSFDIVQYCPETSGNNCISEERCYLVKPSGSGTVAGGESYGSFISFNAPYSNENLIVIIKDQTPQEGDKLCDTDLVVGDFCKTGTSRGKKLAYGSVKEHDPSVPNSKAGEYTIRQKGNPIAINVSYATMINKLTPNGTNDLENLFCGQDGPGKDASGMCDYSYSGSGTAAGGDEWKSDPQYGDIVKYGLHTKDGYPGETFVIVINGVPDGLPEIGKGKTKNGEYSREKNSKTVYLKIADRIIAPNGKDTYEIFDPNGNLTAKNVPKKTILDLIPDLVSGKDPADVFCDAAHPADSTTGVCDYGAPVVEQPRVAPGLQSQPYNPDTDEEMGVCNLWSGVDSDMPKEGPGSKFYVCEDKIRSKELFYEISDLDVYEKIGPISGRQDIVENGGLVYFKKTFQKNVNADPYLYCVNKTLTNGVWYLYKYTPDCSKASTLSTCASDPALCSAGDSGVAEDNFTKARKMISDAGFDPEILPNNYTKKDTVVIEGNTIQATLTQTVASPNGRGTLILGDNSDKIVCYAVTKGPGDPKGTINPCPVNGDVIKGMNGKGMGVKVKLKKLVKNGNGSVDSTYKLGIISNTEHTELKDIKPLSFAPCNDSCTADPADTSGDVAESTVQPLAPYNAALGGLQWDTVVSGNDTEDYFAVTYLVYCDSKTQYTLGGGTMTQNVACRIGTGKKGSVVNITETKNFTCNGDAYGTIGIYDGTNYAINDFVCNCGAGLCYPNLSVNSQGSKQIMPPNKTTLTNLGYNMSGMIANSALSIAITKTS
ncbi:MAG: hypothetical protein PHH82_01260 [Candidatus ainarchaeum sp.]|nr:hypothetical protein [Candidatus ainarchaeum sp.]